MKWVARSFVMKNNFLVNYLFLVLFLSSCSGVPELLAQLPATLPSTSSTTVAASLALVSGSSYDFGNKAISTSTSATLTLSNSGDASATITAITTNSPFSVSGGTCSVSSVIAVSGSCTVKLYYNPSQIGVYSKSFSISYQTNSVSKTTSAALAATAGTPAQSFALMDANDGTTQFDQYLAMNTVDGIAVRLSWDTIQPTSEASYTWTKIDQAFASAIAANKKVTLHILSSVYGATPSWVYSAGGVSYTYTKPGGGGTKTDPLPWDSVYLNKWSGFLTALKSHLVSQNYLSSLEYLSVGAPVPEMSLVGCVNTDINGATAGYGVGSYNRTSYLDAWKSSVSSTVSAFPTTKLLLPAAVQHICFSDNDGGTFYKDVFTYAQGLSPSQFYHYATDLNATASGSARLALIPTSPTNYFTQAPVGLQYTWSYTQDSGVKLGGTLSASTCDRGIKILGGSYFEVYKDDLNNSNASVQDAIEAIHEPWTCP